MEKINVRTAPLEHDEDDPEGYHADAVKIGPKLGAETMVAGLYELPPGQSNCPYHYESDEEWLLVLSGRLTVRHPDGEEEVGPDELVVFPGGPRGAHKLTNRGEETVRLLIWSTRVFPAIAVYPDSDKIGVFTEDRSDNIMVQRESGVGYWEGEV